MTTNATLLATAGVPAFLCPQGAKVRILNLGTMRVDAGWYAPDRLDTVSFLESHIAQAPTRRQ